MYRRILRSTFALGVLSASHLSAQHQAAPTCDDEAYRQFDFWVGEWDVAVASTGQVAGTNKISRILNGCVLHEEYVTPRGFAGFSYNAYDRSTGLWHQTWVDNSGIVLKLEGGVEDGKMVLSGPGKDPQGNDIVNRITWTPHADGSVQQTWSVSNDGGGDVDRRIRWDVSKA